MPNVTTLTVTEFWTGDKLTERTAQVMPVWVDPAEEAARWVERLGARPYRNGWQKVINALAGSYIRVSFERCDADDVQRAIDAVTVEGIR